MTPIPKLTARGRGRSVALITLALLVQAVAAGAAAFATRDLFGSLAIEPRAPNLLALMTIAISGIGIAMCRITARLLGERMGQSYAYDVRKALYTHASALPRQLIANRRAGAMSLRFVGDLTALRSWASLGLPALLSALVLLPGMLGILFLIEPAFGLVTLPLFATAIILMALLARGLKDVNRRLRRARGRIAADMSERMANAPFLRAIGRKARELDLLEKRTQVVITQTMHRVRMAEIVRAVPEILAGFSTALVIWIGFRSGLSTASIAGALAALGLGLQPLRDLALVWNRHAAWRAAHDKCVKALAHDVGQVSVKRSVKTPRKPVSVAVHELPVCAVGMFSAKAKAGTKTCIIGAAGTGKSRLMSMIAGHDPAAAQNIKIGGTTLSAFNARQCARMISLVTIDDPLLKGSFRRALTLGLRARPDDDVVIAVALEVGLGAVLERLGGLDGQIAEGGHNLSSGERAACLAVRAMLGTTPIILLDGVVEMLDFRARAALGRWLKTSIATIFVACRDQTLDIAFDNVWALEPA